MIRLYLSIIALFAIMSAKAQYYQIPYPNAGENPGALNTDLEYPVGGGIAAGWTTTLGPSATPVWSTSQALPFSFQFNGANVNNYLVSNSGCVTFDTGTPLAAPGFNAIALPSATIPNNSICALGIRGTAANDNVVTKTFGTAPNRQFWIQFNSYSNANANDFLYYSIVLEETSNKIYIVDNRTSGTASMSLGVQVNAATGWMVTGSPALASLSNGNPDVTDNSYYAFIYGTQAAYDMTVTKISTADYLAAGNVNITGTVRNLGTTTITSFDLNYTIDGGATITAAVTGVNITSLSTYNFTHSTPWNATIGTHIIDVWASNLNGANVDANPADDHRNKSVSVMSENIQRQPLFEIFTSSTCPPCKPGNENFHTIINGKPANDFVYIKYQEDFPGTGDPYCTTEAVNRRNFYAINSIPRMEIDGGWDGNANSFTQALYDASRAIPANYKMSGEYNVNGQTVYMKLRFSPLFNAPAGGKIHVAILEKKTTANVKTNGETEFLQVMKKMVPNDNGTNLPNTAIGSWDSLSLNYSFKGNYRLPSDGQAANRINHTIEHSVEEFSDLMVIAWIQGANKTVYQALNLLSVPSATNEFTKNINNIEVYPNPASDVINIQLQLENQENITMAMADISGNIVYSNMYKLNTGNNTIQVPVEKLSNGIYHIMLFDNKNNSSVHKVQIMK